MDITCLFLRPDDYGMTISRMIISEADATWAADEFIITLATLLL